MVNPEWIKGNAMTGGYKDEIIEKYGIIEISEGELLGRVEFSAYDNRDSKIVYALVLGWRYNKEKNNWYRIRGY